MDFIFSGFLSLFGEETLTSITTISETLMADPKAFYSDQTALLEIGAQLAATPGLMDSLVFTTAVIALIFTPFFAAYKAHFFKALIAAQAVVAAAQEAAKKTAEEDSAAAENEFAEMKEESKDAAVPAEEKNPFILLQQKENTRQTPQNTAYDPHAGEDGEYDAKGRWFKYK